MSCESSRSTHWRAMGMWRTGVRFLVVMGRSPGEVLRLLDRALEEYTAADFRDMDALWIERWGRDEDDDWFDLPPRWLPEIPLSLGRIKTRHAARRLLRTLDEVSRARARPKGCRRD